MADVDRIRVQVLGPIRLSTADGTDVTPTGTLQRRLLALLVARRGHRVAADTAIEALWSHRRPDDPTGALQNHVSRLRRELPALRIESVGDGYRLDASTVDVDADRLAALVADGELLDDRSLDEIGQLLDRWTGVALPELEVADCLAAEKVQIEELCSRAAEVRAGRRLAIGDTDGLIAELWTLVDADPLRERPRALLISALAAAGRRVEALRAYDDYRRLLGAELGIEPSPILSAQHAALLGDDGAAGPERTTEAAERGVRPVPATRLPEPTTSLIGREQLLADIVELADVSRLVTLVGPAGVGKSRLLVEAGHRIRVADPHCPVVLCELATATEASVIHAAAASLGIDARPDRDVADQIASVLGDRATVLLADNCEHVLGSVADLVERVLARCPSVRVVATSRERLRIAGEQVLPVPALPIEGEDSPAVELFVDRGRASMPGFDPGDDERRAAYEIVRRLDGLPLAIELAAARLFTHDVFEILTGLDRRFELLSAGYRTSDRHGSLGAAVSWSFDMLDVTEQDTFTAVSVFVGSFTVADAAAICRQPADAVGDVLALLVERSLVTRTRDRRFRLLETLRAFGAEQLATTGRRDVIGQRHAEHLLAWVEAADRALFQPGGTTIADIDAALPELRAALDWMLDHGEVELAGRLVCALLDFGVLRLRPDVLAWALRVSAADPHDRSPVAARVWVVAAYAAWMAGDVAENGRRSERARASALEHGGPMPPEVATIEGNYSLFTGQLERATASYRRAAELARDDHAQRVFAAATELLPLAYRGDPAAEERAAVLLAEVGHLETPYAAYAWYCAAETDLVANPDRARDRFAVALELADRTGASFVAGLAGASAASIEARSGDPFEAARRYRGLIDHWRRAGMWSTQWTMLRSIAGLLARLGRERDAAVLVGAVRATSAGHRIFGADEATLDELEVALRRALGDVEFDEAVGRGSVLDGDTAVEHALRAL